VEKKSGAHEEKTGEPRHLFHQKEEEGKAPNVYCSVVKKKEKKKKMRRKKNHHGILTPCTTFWKGGKRNGKGELLVPEPGTLKKNNTLKLQIQPNAEKRRSKSRERKEEHDRKGRKQNFTGLIGRGNFRSRSTVSEEEKIGDETSR